MVSSPDMDTTDTNKLLLPGAVLVAGVLIAGAVIWSNSNPTPSDGGTPPSTAVDIKDVKMDGDPFIGSADAPVTIAYWSDYQCPFCKKFETESLPLIVKNYVDTGKAKVVFMDYAFLGPASTMIGTYGRAVAKLYPDKYFAWRIAVYEDQQPENTLSEAETLAWLKKITQATPGVDWAAVETDERANRSSYVTALDDDRAEGQGFGVNATPAFIIGKELIVGAYPYATFAAAIEKAL